LRTTDKKAADAYDKALETAERLADLLRHDRVLPGLAEHDLEELTIYTSYSQKLHFPHLTSQQTSLTG